VTQATDATDQTGVHGGVDLTGPRPQPIGVLPWPAGMLVVLDVPGAADLCRDLVSGTTPRAWPEALEFLRIAVVEEDPESAARHVHGTDVVARYNRAVLVGADRALWTELAAQSSGDLRVLVDTARFSVGATDEAPEIPVLDGEVAAVARSARASAALERGDAATATRELAEGAVLADAAGSPLLAVSLRATRADLLREALGDAAGAAREADEVLRSMPKGVPADLRAEILVTRALARQELAGESRGPLMAVVSDLQEALRTFHEDTHPEAFATCNQHLALAYLVMPMGDDGDRLRLGIAVTSLRAALRVLTPQTHPVAWASAQVNLANSLQYLPSVHQEQNLDEAVQLYEQVLAYRDEAVDPVGVARILINQGNALGHLGAFADAAERLGRARELFASVGDDEGVAAADELLSEVSVAVARTSIAPGQVT
jgi:tetratricopeptide (TPR) repeat protein